WLSIDLGSGYIEQWKPLISASGDEEVFAEHYREATRQTVTQFLTFDTRNPNSIFSAVTSARENARIDRQYITLEMWEQINRFYMLLQSAARDAARGLEPNQDFFSEVTAASHLFLGITDSTMTHNEGWHFCRLGR